MKSRWHILVGTLAIAMIGLSACSKNKGGSGASAATPPASQPANPSGIPGTGGSGQIKPGTWRGSIGIVNMELYRQMMMDARRCGPTNNGGFWGWGYYLQNCNALSGYMYVTVNVRGGFVPGPGQFSLTPAIYGNWSSTMTKQGDAYLNSDNNGFQIHSYNYPNYNYWGGNNQQQMGQIKVINYYTDSSQNTLTTQVFYKDQKIAEGQTRINTYSNGYYY